MQVLDAVTEETTTVPIRTIETEDIGDEDYQEGDHDHFTHIVNPPANLHIWTPGMTAQEMVDIAKEHGYPLRALCGKVFVPKRDTQKFDSCMTCIKIAGELIAADE